MGRWKSKDPKPRVGFCWHCGGRLYGRQHVERVIDGEPRVLHKSCERAATRPAPTVLTEDDK